LGQLEQTRESTNIIKEIAHVLRHRNEATTEGRELFLGNRFDNALYLCMSIIHADKAKVSQWAREYLEIPGWVLYSSPMVEAAVLV
jgi:hypothetical protein